MNEAPPNEIRIFRPFDEGFNLMKRMLFQPFDLSKWLALGFAAFLAGHFNAGGGMGFGGGNWGQRARNDGANPAFGFGEHQALFIGIIVGLVAFFVIFALVYMWVRARGVFVFTDCLVRERAVIKEPWRDYRKEGNSYFLFSLAVTGIVLLVLAIVGGLIFLFATLVTLPREAKIAIWIAIGAICALGYISGVVIIGLINYFMPMVMYRRRCRSWEAFRIVGALIWQDPGSFVLFALFGILLFLGWMMAAGVVTCATCCMAILPYVGTVLLLPVFVWFRGYAMFYLRQFGNDYDVWAGVIEAPPEQIEPAPPAL